MKDPKALLYLLSEAQTEITSLRRRNELLQAKVDVMDLFAVALHTTPNYPNQGCQPDVVWQIQNEINEISECIQNQKEQS